MMGPLRAMDLRWRLWRSSGSVGFPAWRRAEAADNVLEFQSLRILGLGFTVYGSGLWILYGFDQLQWQGYWCIKVQARAKAQAQRRVKHSLETRLAAQRVEVLVTCSPAADVAVDVVDVVLLGSTVHRP